ncbi:MAG: DNA (cytosine-5-)-methyltransferase [Candidatus Thermoplasmatota archaeon]
METLRVVDLFAGLGGFHLAASKLGHECVFASEIDARLREGYATNFKGETGPVVGDIRKHVDEVPRHDILCAGFPCQPFSKSGFQNGVEDQTRGTLFNQIVQIAAQRKPSTIVLENVGNFERHDGGNTWRTVRAALEKLGYNVRGTEHKASGGHGLMSPHHFGHPHHRERFFAIASLEELPDDPFPREFTGRGQTLADLVEPNSDLNKEDKAETKLTDKQVRCVEHWNSYLAALPESQEVPHPLWGDEFGARYLYASTTPHGATPAQLRESMGDPHFRKYARKSAMLAQLPSYARTPQDAFPKWKVAFIKRNRDHYTAVKGELPKGWMANLKTFPASLRKLEFNCKGESRDLWEHVLQFRPSGLRAKRYTAAPALVAMTTTQVPILGPKKRFLTRREGLLLQGFPKTWAMPKSRGEAFQALGNGVHVDVARRIVKAATTNWPTATSNSKARMEAMVVA